MKHVVFITVFLLSNSSFFGQCGFDIARKKMMENPDYINQQEVFERKIKKYIESGQHLNKSSIVNTIPVVVHVLHLGETVGSGTNISDAQIQSGIDRLNTIYRGLDPNSPIDFEIEFALAQRDPNCNATTGINRIDASSVPLYSSVGVGMDTEGADENTLKDLSRWPETDYFNVWIVSEIDGNNGGSGIQGYANFYEGSPYEGSVMMYTVFGYDPTNSQPSWPLTYSRDNSTVIHEFGHYFHLYHTFEGDNGGGSCPADSDIGVDSDGCADTEIHKRHTSTCPTNNDCNGGIPYGFNTLKNFMSYFGCTDRFTNDQKIRVQGAMSGTAIMNSKGAQAPDASYSAPIGGCLITSPQTNNAGIMNVELNGLNMESGSSNYDGGTIEKSTSCSNFFEIDASISNTINVEMYSVNYQQLGIWIDWNDDGDFNDESEQQHLSQDIQAGSNVAVTISLPSSIPYGDYVELRLITDLDDRYGASTISGSCFTPSYGQAENYALYIKSAGVGLPVTFKEVNASAIDNEYVNITWITASEINNDYFNVERSTDGVNWENIYKINSVRGGNSSQERYYNYTDWEPYKGTAYYRIKQVDFDGKNKYSSTKTVYIDQDVKEVILYPNPTKDVIYVEASSDQLYNLHIYTILGQNISSSILIERIAETKIAVHLESLKSGLYYIKTNSEVYKAYKE